MRDTIFIERAFLAELVRRIWSIAVLWSIEWRYHARTFEIWLGSPVLFTTILEPKAAKIKFNQFILVDAGRRSEFA